MHNIILKIYPNGDKQYKIYKKGIYDIKDDDVRLEKVYDKDRYEELRELYYNDTCNENIAKEFENLQLKLARKWKLQKGLSEEETEISKEKHKNYVRNKNDKRDKQKIYDLARSNEWHWFGTFTFSSDKVNRYDYEECYKKLSNWLHNVKKRKCKDLKYLFIPEQHEDKAWHFHCLLANVEELTFVQAINNNKDSKYYGLPLYDNKGNAIYNIEEYTLGFTNLSKVRDTRRVSMYITKYITKGNCIKLEGRNRHIASRNLNKPVVQHSLADEKEIQTFLDSIDGTEKWKKTKKVAENTAYENEVTYIEI